jgi:aminomethyltransferase
MATGDRATPLLDAHVRLGAKLTDFAGWSMPLQYSGIIAEHNAVRETAGIFDVSHLGKLRVAGDGEALQHALTADVYGLEVGRATYSLVCTDDGGCVDDVFVYRLAGDEWLVVPNAANVAAVAREIEKSGGAPVDEWDRWAILALQGPDSFEIFDKAIPGSPAGELRLHSWCPIDVLGEGGLVARTGYTGERGFELYAPHGRAEAVFERFLEAGAAPVGLGARDTLRLEMGYAFRFEAGGAAHERQLFPDPGHGDRSRARSGTGAGGGGRSFRSRAQQNDPQRYREAAVRQEMID